MTRDLCLFDSILVMLGHWENDIDDVIIQTKAREKNDKCFEVMGPEHN